MRKLRDEGPVIGDVGDLMLARVWPHTPRLGADSAPQGLRLGAGGCRPRQGRDTRATVRSASQFDGPAREELQQVAARFCSSQSVGLELVKARQRKDSRFQLFMQARAAPAPAQQSLELTAGPALGTRGWGAARAPTPTCSSTPPPAPSSHASPRASLRRRLRATLSAGGCSCVTSSSLRCSG